MVFSWQERTPSVHINYPKTQELERTTKKKIKKGKKEKNKGKKRKRAGENKSNFFQYQSAVQSGGSFAKYKNSKEKGIKKKKKNNLCRYCFHDIL